MVCVSNETIQQFQIVAESHKLATLIDACFHTMTLSDNSPRLISWHPCRTNCMVLNVDGSCLGNPGRAGFGGLIRNGGGEWIVRFSGFLGIANNTLAELMTLYHGLKIARASAYHRFFCYSDSKTVSDLVTKGEGNVCADFLAKLGSTNDDKLSMWESPPNDLKKLISADALRVAYTRA
ncbi:ribonuclease H [Trifolium pratense]|uniref:Ribonuclease H n=1 Tax=Trifolium pratense TaxID=57577 RepID=A0A2K3LXW3_TRIPR|nr:ribonuclease H [Trifolium pratense]